MRGLAENSCELSPLPCASPGLLLGRAWGRDAPWVPLASAGRHTETLHVCSTSRKLEGRRKEPSEFSDWKDGASVGGIAMARRANSLGEDGVGTEPEQGVALMAAVNLKSEAHAFEN